MPMRSARSPGELSTEAACVCTGVACVSGAASAGCCVVCDGCCCGVVIVRFAVSFDAGFMGVVLVIVVTCLVSVGFCTGTVSAADGLVSCWNSVIDFGC